MSSSVQQREKSRSTQSFEWALLNTRSNGHNAIHTCWESCWRSREKPEDDDWSHKDERPATPSEVSPLADCQVMVDHWWTCDRIDSPLYCLLKHRSSSLLVTRISSSHRNKQQKSATTALTVTYAKLLCCHPNVWVWQNQLNIFKRH